MIEGEEKTKKFYVYVHRYASGHKEGQVFYVGKGQGRRYKRTNRNFNRHWVNTVKKYGFIPEIVMRFYKEECAYSLERALINHYGIENLTNLTNGGVGVSSPSEEIRNKISISKIGDKNHFYGKPLSDTHKEKISKSQIGDKNHMWGKKHKQETIEKMSISRTGKINIKKSKPVINDCGMWFYGAIDAVRYLKINGFPIASKSNITKCCKGKQKTAYGYEWNYA
jgi:group I intron endonuclease